MLGKTTQLLVVSILAAAVVGCAESLPMRGFAAEGRAAPADVAELDEAIRLAMDLEYNQAIAKLSRVTPRLEAAGDGTRVAESRFWTGYCYEKLGRVGVAGAFYRSIVLAYPRTPAARQAQHRLDALAESGESARPLSGR